MLVSQFKDPHRKYPSKLYTIQYKQKLIVHRNFCPFFVYGLRLYFKNVLASEFLLLVSEK